uniref:C2H2-type domain-containing protein n=1 Tax=Panagrellus redivivus TaxID=6233 RepID=A0A7E4VSN0_PANRE
MFDTDGNMESHPGWDHFDQIDEGTLACRHCGICFTELDLDVLLAHLEDRHSGEDFETFSDAVENQMGDNDDMDAFMDDLQRNFDELDERFEESEESSPSLPMLRSQASHSSSSSPSTSIRTVPNRKRLPDSANEPSIDYPKSKLGRFLSQVDSIRHSKVADDGSEEQIIMLENMRKRIYPKWNLVAKFTSKTEFDKAVKARFVVSVEKKKIKRCRRYGYVCQVARYCKCDYRMMTLRNDFVFYLYDYGKHNHPEMDRKVAIEAESKARLEAVMKRIGYEPFTDDNHITESDETVNNASNISEVSLQKPPLSPMGKAKVTVDIEFQSKLFAKYENDLTSCWVLVSRPTSKAVLFKAVREAGVACGATSTVYHVVRRRYYCKKKADFECPYRMYCIYSDTQCALYEAGRHNHDESDQSTRTKNQC